MRAERPLLQGLSSPVDIWAVCTNGRPLLRLLAERQQSRFPIHSVPAANQQLVDAYRSHRPTTLPDTGNAGEPSRPASAIVQLVPIRQSITAQKIPSCPPCRTKGIMI